MKLTRFVVVAVVLSAVVVDAAPLRRELNDYTIFGGRVVRLKNFAIEEPACNIGVNCPRPGNSKRCGFLRGPSNFVFSASRELAGALAPLERHAPRLHLTRGDGDGPLHL